MLKALAWIALLPFRIVSGVARGIGDAAIALAGGHRETLRKWDVDRAYFVGLGFALILAATTAAVSLGAATAIAFHLRPTTKPVIIASSVYFVLILSLDRFLVSDPTAGFASDQTGISKAAAWVGHLIGEVIKSAPRIAVAFVGSILFANFMLLVIFNPEVQEQLKVIQLSNRAHFDQQVDARAAEIRTSVKGIIDNAEKQETTLQASFVKGTGILADAAAKKNATLAALAAQGVKCHPYSQLIRHVNSRGVVYYTRQYYDGCPRQIQDINNSYNALAAKYPATQADVDKRKAAVENAKSVKDARSVYAGAHAQAEKELAQGAPAGQDGLLARMRALDLLTTPTTGPCPAAKPSDLSALLNPNCVSQYSLRASNLQRELRYWLLFLELVPIAMKLVNSILPQRGYARTMAATEAEATSDADKRKARARIDARIDEERYLREERVELEVASALQEAQRRERARGEERLLLRRMWERFEAARNRNHVDTAQPSTPPTTSNGHKSDVQWEDVDRYHIGQNRVTSEDFLDN
jgi:hypothetical protein